MFIFPGDCGRRAAFPSDPGPSEDPPHTAPAHTRTPAGRGQYHTVVAAAHANAHANANVSLLQAAASSDGALTLDLIHEEEPRPRTNTGSSRKHHTLPREVPTHTWQGPEPGAAPDSNQDTSGDPEATRATSGDPEPTRATSGDPEPTRDQEAEQEEARRLLLEAKAQWNQALQVLTEVQELKQLFLQLNKRGGAKPS
uniref:Uncharacterized protein n=1 Tax=Neogobius melanostomus TaxID=47308 RepID=A0A8C6UID1_9GOBI